METFDLVEFAFTWQNRDYKLTFSSAQLVVVTELGTRLWYIDMNGVAQHDVLAAFASSDDLAIRLRAVTAGGRTFSGGGFLHPNVAHEAAAIRGDGELDGYARKEA